MNKCVYFIKEGFKNVWANWVISLATISVLTLCLLLLGTSLMVSVNVKNLIAQIESTNQIAVFLKTDLDKSAVEAVGREIRKIPNVDKVVFISKEAALEEQKKELGEYAQLLEGYDKDNFLPDSYQVSLKDIRQYADTAKQLARIDGVKSTTQHVEIAQKLAQISNVIGIVGFWLFAILAVVSLFIVSNTIKSAVFTRRREINIMKFVGATDSFIRWPFIVEGLIIGLISSLLAFGCEWLIYSGLILKVFDVLRIANPVPFKSMMWVALGGFTLSGVIVGVSGSMLSIRRHLRV